MFGHDFVMLLYINCKLLSCGCLYLCSLSLPCGAMYFLAILISFFLGF